MDRIPGNRFVEGCTYFVTMTLLERQPLFADPRAAEITFRELQYYRHKHEIELYAYVIMPDHVHVVLRPIGHLTLPRWVRRFKTFVAHALEQGPIWMRDYWSEYLWDDEMIAQKIEYIHRNPIRRGLVNEVGDYPWSSIADYYFKAKLEFVDDFKSPHSASGG